jgi:Mrp family chromosome partitioning ATPase
MIKLPSSAFLRRPRLQPALLGRTSRGSRDLQTHTFCSSGPSWSHDNPLGLPGQQAGLPWSGSPPKLNISRSLPTNGDIPNVRKVLVVASGKGGVGKSTVAGLSHLILVSLDV